MSLRKKLYLGFAVTIILAMITGIQAIVAFRATNARVEKTRDDVAVISGVLMPVSNLMFRIRQDIISASLYYSLYGVDHEADDFALGEDNVRDSRERTEEVLEILARAPASLLPRSRETMPQIRDYMARMAEVSGELNRAVGVMNDLVAETEAGVAAMRAILEAMNEELVVELNDALTNATEPGLTPFVARVIDADEFLEGLRTALDESEVLFWKGQTQRGAAALDTLAAAGGRLTAAAADIGAYVDAGRVRSPEMVERFRELQTHFGRFSQVVAGFDQAWRATDQANADLAAISEPVLAIAREVEHGVSNEVTGSTSSVADATVAIDNIVDRSTMITVVVLALALLVGGVSALIITQGIVGPVNRVIEALTRQEGEIGHAATEISEASHSLAEGVTEQAASLEETSSALEEVSAMTRTNSDNAGHTSDNARTTLQLVSEGAAAMRDMSTAMADINEKTDRVGQIIKTIEEIAVQTNLLALNAAVEAARAGEAGKGFAVVADEVRNLSQRSAQAVKDTTELISGTVESVRHGSGIVQRLTEGFSTIETGISGISEHIGQIAQATNEQSQGIEQINNAVSQLDKVTQRNAASSTETASSCQQLEEQVTELRGNIGSLQHIIYGKRLPPARRLPGSKAMKLLPAPE